MTKMDVLRSWYQRIWVEGDLDAIEDFFHDDAEETGLVPELHVRPTEFRDLIEALSTLLDAPHFELHPICEDDEWVTATVTAHARAIEGGAPIKASGMVAVRIRDGKFMQAINSFDFMKLFEDLGILPPGALLTCLTGARLTQA